MRCRSYPKTTKLSMTTPSTPSSTRRTTACNPVLTIRTTGSNMRASNLPLCKEHKTVKGCELLPAFRLPQPAVFRSRVLVACPGSWRKWSAGSSRRAGAEHPGYLAGVGSAEARCTCPSGSYSQLAGAMLFHRYRRPLHVYCECLVTNQLTTPSGNSKRRMQRAPFLNTRNGVLRSTRGAEAITRMVRDLNP